MFYFKDTPVFEYALVKGDNSEIGARESISLFPGFLLGFH